MSFSLDFKISNLFELVISGERLMRLARHGLQTTLFFVYQQVTLRINTFCLKTLKLGSFPKDRHAPLKAY